MTDNPTEDNDVEPDPQYREGDEFGPDVYGPVELILSTWEIYIQQDERLDQPVSTGVVVDRELNPEYRPEGSVKYTFELPVEGELNLEEFLDTQGRLMGINQSVQLSLVGVSTDGTWTFEAVVPEE